MACWQRTTLCPCRENRLRALCVLQGYLAHKKLAGCIGACSQRHGKAVRGETRASDAARDARTSDTSKYLGQGISQLGGKGSKGGVKTIDGPGRRRDEDWLMFDTK